MDLTYFLDAAHGDEFSHQTCRDRDRRLKKKATNPADPVPVPESLCLNPTNVHVLWLMQEIYFVKYWALLTVTKPIGLAQRCLFSFGAKRRHTNFAWNGFFDKVAGPLLQNIFTFVLQKLGPKATIANNVITLSKAQSLVASRVEETLAIYAGNKSLVTSFRDCLPKAYYWLGTALLHNHTMSASLGNIWATRTGTDTSISDEVFCSAVRFLHRRYLRGQNVLSTAVAEQAWFGIDAPVSNVPDETELLMVTLLRHAPGPILNLTVLMQVDLRSKRSVERGTPQQQLKLKQQVDNILHTFVDLGLGAPLSDETGRITAVRKFKQKYLSKTARCWLMKNRVSLSLFGQNEPMDVDNPA
eukprot:6651110-Karenia_brevis.AAC.1